MNLRRLNKIDFSGEIHLTDKPTNTDMILIKKGDLVISGINVEKGAVSVYQGKEDILATIHYSAYLFDESRIDIEYFKTFLKSKNFKEAINSQIKGGIKTELKPNKFLPLEIKLPDLEMQVKIRNKINSISEKVTKLDEIDNLNESYISKLRQRILQDAVQGKLVQQDPQDEPASELLKKIKTEKDRLIKDGKIRNDKPLAPISDEEKPYGLPKGWEWTKLGEVCQRIHYGYTASAVHNTKGIRLLRITDIQNDKVNWLEVPSCQIDNSESEKYLLNENDILIARTGGTIGKSYMVKNVNVKAVFASYLIRAIPNKTINPAYVKLFLGSSLYWQQLFEESMGTGQPNVNGVALSNLKVPLPPLAEQKRIVEKVDTLMALCDELEKQVKENQENSERLVESVLQESFSN
ncbi:MAG: restriction endonuclease subunit S [Nanoarchaeota archaeon]